MPERRYTENEVAEIFKLATDPEQPARSALPPGEGMTLAQLQDIGREAGIASERVAQAARALARGELPASRRFLGLTIGVGRTAALDRQITEAEWERLVVDLRETFDARGVVRSDGAFRQWTNGNLQALLEPTATGHQLRLRTTNATARGLMLAGLGLLGISAAAFVSAIVTADFANAASRIAPLLVVGSGLLGIGALRLPRWARERAQQMEGVASRFGSLGAPSD